MSTTKWVLRYLKGTVDYGLFFTKGPLHLNAADKRSTSESGVFLGNCLISWLAKKQLVVSRSSTESEYRSMKIAIVEFYWLRMLLRELQIPLEAPPQLWCDKGALALTSNPIFHARIKYIEVTIILSHKKDCKQGFCCSVHPNKWSACWHLHWNGLQWLNLPSNCSQFGQLIWESIYETHMFG